MSYATTSHYEAEILFRNRLAPPPEPTMGNNPGRNTPLNRTDDSNLSLEMTPFERELLCQNESSLCFFSVHFTGSVFSFHTNRKSSSNLNILKLCISLRL